MKSNLPIIVLMVNALVSGLLCAPALAQAPSIQWQKCYGGTGVDGGNSVCRTPDGGYIMAGYSNSTNGQVTGNHGGMDCWVVKTDDTGAIQWEKSYGGSGDEQVDLLQNDVNGGYILACYTNSNDGDVSGNHGGDDAWIIKIDDTGHIVWQKVMGSTGFDFANSAVNTSDSGYLIVGSAGADNGDVSGLFGANDVWVIRLDKTGALVWDKVYGSTGNEYGFNGITTADGGYIITAQAGAANGEITTFRGGTADAWILKLNATGTIEWQKTYGGSGFDQAVGITTATNGGYVFSATTYSDDGEVTGFHGATSKSDIWMVEIDDTGAIKWENCFGGTGNEQAGDQLLRALDGSYVLSGATDNNSGEVSGDHGFSDFWVTDVDTNGSLVWQECLGGAGFDTSVFIVQTPDSGFVVVGGTTSTAGEVSGNHGSEDYWLVKLYKSDTLYTTGTQQIAKLTVISIYPSPVADELHVTATNEISDIAITNLLGETVYCKRYSGVDAVDVSVSGLAVGVYFIKINGTEVRKFLKE